MQVVLNCENSNVESREEPRFEISQPLCTVEIFQLCCPFVQFVKWHAQFVFREQTKLFITVFGYWLLLKQSRYRSSYITFSRAIRSCVALGSNHTGPVAQAGGKGGGSMLAGTWPCRLLTAGIINSGLFGHVQAAFKLKGNTAADMGDPLCVCVCEFACLSGAMRGLLSGTSKTSGTSLPAQCHRSPQTDDATWAPPMRAWKTVGWRRRVTKQSTALSRFECRLSLTHTFHFDGAHVQRFQTESKVCWRVEGQNESQGLAHNK